MEGSAIQSKIKRVINFAILSKPTKERLKHSLNFGIFGDFSIGHFITKQHVFLLSMGIRFSMQQFPSNISIFSVQKSDLMVSVPQKIVSSMIEQLPFDCSSNLFAKNCEKVMVPDEYLSLDDTLYPTRVSVAFHQYNENKPAKYELLFQSINTQFLS